MIVRGTVRTLRTHVDPSQCIVVAMRQLIALLASAACFAPAFAQPPAPSANAFPQALIADLVTANRILANEGVLDGYGHVSVRNPANANRFFLARSVA